MKTVAAKLAPAEPDPDAVVLPPLRRRFPEIPPPPIRVVHKGFWGHRETTRPMQGLDPDRPQVGTIPSSAK
jgi:hypothetical protein